MNAHMPRILGFTTLAVLGFLLIACFSNPFVDDGDGPQNAVCGDQGVHSNKMADSKEKEFQRYQTIDREFRLPLSTMSKAFALNGEPLVNWKLFGDSIEANRKDPYGATYQMYNYVVCEEVSQNGVTTTTILVAKWKVGTIRGVSRCHGPKFEVAGRKGKMINFFPEEADTEGSLRGPQSPCWLSDLNGKVKAGLLDAISKHYMLAQGEGTSIAAFDADRMDEWSSTEVRYAGEIIVDVKNCEYSLNNNSGTYQPRLGDETVEAELKYIANLFSRKLGVGPASVVDVKVVSGVRAPDILYRLANMDDPTSRMLPDCQPAR